MAEGVTMPDNPYTRMLESITAGRGTVSLPPPVPIPDEPIQDTVEEATEPNVSTLTHQRPSPPPVSILTHPLHAFDGLDLRTNEVWGDNGETFAMTPAEIEEAGQLCLRVAKRVMAGRLAELESRFAGKLKRGPRKKQAGKAEP
jgi:hypothetical protein